VTGALVGVLVGALLGVVSVVRRRRRVRRDLAHALAGERSLLADLAVDAPSRPAVELRVRLMAGALDGTAMATGTRALVLRFLAVYVVASVALALATLFYVAQGDAAPAGVAGLLLGFGLARAGDAVRRLLRMRHVVDVLDPAGATPRPGLTTQHVRSDDSTRPE